MHKKKRKENIQSFTPVQQKPVYIIQSVLLLILDRTKYNQMQTLIKTAFELLPPVLFMFLSRQGRFCGICNFTNQTIDSADAVADHPYFSCIRDVLCFARLVKSNVSLHRFNTIRGSFLYMSGLGFVSIPDCLKSEYVPVAGLH